METLLLSHPDQALHKHLMGVSRWTQFLQSNRRIDIWEDGLLNDLLKIISLAHDFAKATVYFQRYIKNPVKKKGGPLERHSLLSAVVGYYLAKYYLGSHPGATRVSFFVYVAIKRHHGNLQDFENEHSDFKNEDRELLIKQVKSIDFSLLEKTWIELRCELPPIVATLLPFTRELLEKWVDGMQGELKLVRRWWLKNVTSAGPLFGGSTSEKENYILEDYFQLLYMYSLLLDADKRQVGVGVFEKQEVNLPGNLVDCYKEDRTWLNTELNIKRERAYCEIIENLHRSEKGNLFSITLPTGMGKTLAAYNFAFKLRHKRCLERGVAPKIIYALPFLSVIDQNYSVLSEILESQGLMAGHHVLVKHHHLADPLYKMKADGDEIVYSPNASKLLIEGWASEVVVTTFVQLFETMIGWRNSSLRRFHNLAHSIIILDEIQALPISYWALVQRVLEYMVKGMSVDVVLVTATQPKIFNGSVRIQEMVNTQEYFRNMDRVQLHVDLTHRTVGDFAREFVYDEVNTCLDKSFLFIFNTIASAKEFYQLLNEMVNEPVVFLSTGVVMKDRRKRIDDLRDKKYRLAVSTQLVEAGVDIDFDVVYRDFAPMDSINQAAGRCNRNNLNRRGSVRIVYLVREDRKKTFAGMVYDNTALDITREILSGREIIGEDELLELINKYFSQAKERKRAAESYELLEAMEKLRFFTDDQFKTGVNGFRLIKQKGAKANIFVELNSEATEIWSQYEDILNNCGDFYHRQERFNMIKKTFYDYVISVTVNEKTELPPEVNSFLYINQHQLGSYYDVNLGFDTRNYENIF